MRVEESVVKNSLQNVAGLIAGNADEGGYRDFFVFAATTPRPLRCRLVCCCTRTSANHAGEFSQILRFVKPFGRRNRTTCVLDCGRQLNKHQTIKAEISKARIQ